MASPESADQDWRGLYCVGGIMAVLTGIGGLAASRMGYLLYSAGYPSNPTAYLQLVAQKHLLANSLWSLWIFGDLLGFVPSVAFYLVLRRNNRTLALIGTLFVFFYLFYDISVTELNSLTLVSLGEGFTSATTDAARASYVTVATYGYAALPLQTVLSFGVGAIGGFFGALSCCQDAASSRGGWGSSASSSTSWGLSGRLLPLSPRLSFLAFSNFSLSRLRRSG